MPDSKLSFKIKAVDDTKNAFTSSTKNTKAFLANLKDIGKFTKGLPNIFKEFSKQFSKVTTDSKKTEDNFKKMSQHSKKMRGSGEDVADVLKNVNREDVALMQVLKEKGKAFQSSFKENGRDNTTKNPIQEALQSPTGTKINLLRVDKIDAGTINGLGSSGGSGGGGGIKSPEMPGEAGEAGGKGMGALGKAGMVGAIAAAVIGTIYGVLSSRQSAFKNQAEAQILGLQTMGFGANNRMGGFYQGINNGLGGQLKGSQQVSMMSAFAKQTGAGRNQLEGLTQEENNLAQIQNAYGYDAGQLGGWAGNLQRFGQGSSGQGLLLGAMQTAKDSGMGGARQEEFISDLQDAMTDAVYNGSARSAKDLTDNLGTLMKTNDERLKVMAPQILQGSTQGMNQAGFMKGGAAESYMYQSVLLQRKKRGESTSQEDIANQLQGQNKGDWLKTMQDVITTVQQQFGKGYQGAMAMSNMPGFQNFGSYQQILKEMENIKAGTPTTNGNISQDIQQRNQQLQNPLYFTQTQDVRESMNTLSNANKNASVAVDEFRNALQKSINFLSDPVSWFLSKKYATTSNKKGTK